MHILIYSGIYAAWFWITFYLWLVPETIGLFVQRARNKGNAKRQDRGSLLFLFGAVFLGFALAFLFILILPGATITWS